MTGDISAASLQSVLGDGASDPGYHLFLTDIFHRAVDSFPDPLSLHIPLFSEKGNWHNQVIPSSLLTIVASSGAGSGW